jgi:hypothetical protein
MDGGAVQAGQSVEVELVERLLVAEVRAARALRQLLMVVAGDFVMN